MQESAISDETLALAEAVAKDRARMSMLAFAQYIKSNYRTNWHNELLCNKLDDFVSGKIKRLIVEMPPRHGKSELCSRLLPAYILGQNPDAEIIATSYSAELAQAMNRDVQRIIDTTEYNELFAGTKLNSSNIRTVVGNYLRNSDVFEVVGRAGHYRCAGVGGSITGHGGNYIIMDDPIKNQEEAYSLTYRNKLWNWYTSTLYTRLCGDPQGILLVLTRWHEDDLAGRLVKKALEDNADQWEVLRLEAIKEGLPTDSDPRQDGEALWPDAFDLDKLRSIKASTTPSVWSALYQQRPSVEGGNIIEDAWIKHYGELPANTQEWWQSWDLTFDKTTSGSYVVGQVWCREGANCYLVDQVRKRMSFTESIEAVKMMSARYPQALKKMVEKKANGAALLDVLRNEVTGLKPIEPKGSKEDRLRAVSPVFCAGNIHIPNVSKYSWVRDYIEELTHFPTSPHDDQVDCTSQALVDIGHCVDYKGYQSSSKGIRSSLRAKKGGIL